MTEFSVEQLEVMLAEARANEKRSAREEELQNEILNSGEAVLPSDIDPTPPREEGESAKAKDLDGLTYEIAALKEQVEYLQKVCSETLKLLPSNLVAELSQ